jgi:hypothetical protein
MHLRSFVKPLFRAIGRPSGRAAPSRRRAPTGAETSRSLCRGDRGCVQTTCRSLSAEIFAPDSASVASAILFDFRWEEKSFPFEVRADLHGTRRAVDRSGAARAYLSVHRWHEVGHAARRADDADAAAGPDPAGTWAPLGVRGLRPLAAGAASWPRRFPWRRFRTPPSFGRILRELCRGGRRRRPPRRRHHGRRTDDLLNSRDGSQPLGGRR